MGSGKRATSSLSTQQMDAAVSAIAPYIKYAKFEMKNGDPARARSVYERAVDKLAQDDDAHILFLAFAQFEELCNEADRATVIYNFARNHNIRNGPADHPADALVEKMRFKCENEVQNDPLNYDTWLDYIRLEEGVGIMDRIRKIYKRAIANLPPAEEKRHWRRFIYLWINYVLYEELDAEDMERTRDVYRECLKLIPHEKFSFAKIWLMAAQFEIRQLNLEGARRILGNAIGKAPKDEIFKKYIELELQLRNMDRCRKLYAKYLEWSPENCYAWIKYHELERSLCETERARSIFELATAQPALDMPEVLWKAYIDFEIAESEYTRTRELSERLVDRTKLPEKLNKRQRQIVTQEGPTQAPAMKILEAAYKWKRQKTNPEED